MLSYFDAKIIMLEPFKCSNSFRHENPFTVYDIVKCLYIMYTGIYMSVSLRFWYNVSIDGMQYLRVSIVN